VGERIGAVEREHRERVREILVATGAFSPAEVEVALELFDAAATGGEYEQLALFDADRLVAWSCFGPTPSTDRTWDLYWIAVDPARQGSGAGARLLDAVEETLGARGGRLLVAETSSRDDYARTRRFYARQGYDAAARLGDFYAPADDRIIYVKRLPSLPGAEVTTLECERGVSR
jgi:ribosomal protein S18 acetylase RimI-like enzyme